MAVAHDASNSAKSSSVSALSVSLTVANQTNRCLVVMGAGIGNSRTISSVTWNTSETCSNVLNGAFDTGRGSMHYLVAPTATTANATVTWSGSVNECAVGATALYDADQSSPVGTGRSNSATSGNRAYVGCEGVPGGMVVGFCYRDITSSNNPAVADADGIPEYTAVGTRAQSAGATSLSPAAPTGNTQHGVLEFCVVQVKNNDTITFGGSGWTKLDQQNSGASFTAAIAYRISDGSDVAPAPSWTNSAACAARRWFYHDTKADGAPCALIGTHGTGTTSTHTSTGGNTTRNDSRVIYVDCAAANTALAAPSGWTEDFDTGSATDAGRTVVGGKDVASSGTGSGNISVTGANAAWVQWQIEVFNSDAGDQTARTEQEDIADFGAFAISTEPADTYTTLAWDHSAGTTSDWFAIAACFNPASGGTDDLGTPSAIATGAPSVGSPAIGQAHALTATGVSTGAPSVGAPAIGQTHALTATGADTSAPSVGAPSLGQTHVLSATGVAADTPSVGAPALTEVVALGNPSAIAAGAPSVGAPSIGQTHALTATGAATDAPSVGAPAIGQVHALSATGVAAAAPSVGAPTITVPDALTTGELLAGTPSVGAPALGQAHALTATPLQSGPFVIEPSPRLIPPFDYDERAALPTWFDAEEWEIVTGRGIPARPTPQKSLLARHRRANITMRLPRQWWG